MQLDRFDVFFTNLVEKVRELKDSGVKVTTIADKAGISEQTVYKLLNSERGKRPELRTAIMLAGSIGAPMSDILAALLPDHAVKILALHERFPELIDVLYRVLDADTPDADADKLMTDLRYMLSKRPE